MLTWASIAESGSMEMPSVIEGLGSMSEVAWALPFTANIAEGLELESLLVRKHVCERRGVDRPAK